MFDRVAGGTSSRYVFHGGSLDATNDVGKAEVEPLAGDQEASPQH